MNILFTTLNSKFVHSNLAIKYLAGCVNKEWVRTKEYTINENIEDIFFDIIREGYDIVAFSCYIWNIDKTLKIISNIKKAKPETIIMLGGPEVSYEAAPFMEKNPDIDIIIAGEGEEAMIKLNKLLEDWSLYEGGAKETDGLQLLVYLAQKLESTAIIHNIFLNLNGRIINSSNEESLAASMVVEDLSLVGRAYNDISPQDLENKIVYYETSRGCNYNCAYCLSAAQKGIRYFDEARVFEELEKLVALGAKQIKLVDRTFNSDPGRTKRLMEFISRIDNGEINFHFEITAHLLTIDQIEMLKAARKGLFQLEIGVQSTCNETLIAVNRGNNFKKLSHNVLEIKKSANIHQHLDLIAGLPYESLERFKVSFEDVFSLQPEMLQLGFLKLLKGSPIYSQISQYDYKFREYPPYEVISNRFISCEDLIELKEVENALDRYYNKQRYKNSFKYLYSHYKNGYELFKDLAKIIREERIELNQKNEEFRAMLLLSEQAKTRSDSSCSLDEASYNHDFFKELLKLDYLMMGRNPNVPEFLKADYSSTREEVFLIISEELARQELGIDKAVSAKEAFKKINWADFDYDVLMYYNTGRVVKRQNVVLINYGYPKKGMESFKAIRREYEVKN